MTEPIYTRELHQAVRFIRSLRYGDRVVMTHGMGPVVMRVVRMAHRAPEHHGTYESTGVVLTTDHGYVLRVPAQSLVDRFTTCPDTGVTRPTERIFLRLAPPPGTGRNSV